MLRYVPMDINQSANKLLSHIRLPIRRIFLRSRIINRQLWYGDIIGVSIAFVWGGVSMCGTCEIWPKISKIARKCKEIGVKSGQKMYVAGP